MNETILHDSATVVPWPTDDLRMRLPDAPMLADSEKAAPAAEDALHAKAAQWRETRDEWAASADPLVDGERVRHWL